MEELTTKWNREEFNNYKIWEKYWIESNWYYVTGEIIKTEYPYLKMKYGITYNNAVYYKIKDVHYKSIYNNL